MTTDATVAEPTHHITLAAGGTTRGLVLCDAKGLADHRQITKRPIRRMPLKMQQGDSLWSDFELPYQNEAQDDWSGGRGLRNFEDSTRYWHGYMVNTMHKGKAFLGPQPCLTDGYRVHNHDLYGNTTFQGLYGSTEYISRQFTPAANYTARRVEIWAKKVGTPNGNLTIEVWTDDASDKPNAIIAGCTIADSSAFSWISQMLQLTFGTGGSLTGGTKYHLVIYGHASDDASNHWTIGVNATVGSDVVSQSVDDSTWVAASVSPYFHVTDWKDDFIAHFFEYKGQMYFVDQQDDGGTPKLYMNGDRGRSVGASSTTTLEHTGKGWTVDAEIGNILVLVGGTGIGQWREITDNDADTLTVSPVWETTPVTANTEYVILGSDTWTEQTVTGLTGPVTDVLVVKDVVYFAQGEATNIRRFQYAANANSYADDGTNKATFMELVHEGGEDGVQVYKANNAAVSVTVAKAPPQAWGTDLVFATAIDCGNSATLITGLERYFDPEYCIVLKQDQVGRIVGDEYQVMPIREFIAAKSDNTGRASTVAGVYLYLTAMRGLERYYQNRLDDVGPNLDDGLQAGYQGPIYDLLSFPGRVYAAVSGEDWGTGSYGSIQVDNGLGWHPWYRSQAPGSKIRKLYHQVIPGSTPDRMWVSEGGDVIWLHMPSETLDPRRDSNYKYFHEGMLQTSAMSLRLKDIPKTLNSINIWAESLATDAQYITVRYELNWDGTQVDLSGNVDTMPTEELDISFAGSQIQTRDVHFVIVFHTTDETKSPELKATVLEAVAHLPTKFRYSIQFRAGDENIDLRGDEESYAVGAFIAALETWANEGTLLTMRHHNEDGPMDNKSVFISTPTIRPISNIDDENLASYLCTMEMFEAGSAPIPANVDVPVGTLVIRGRIVT